MVKYQLHVLVRTSPWECYVPRSLSLSISPASSSIEASQSVDSDDQPLWERRIKGQVSCGSAAVRTRSFGSNGRGVQMMTFEERRAVLLNDVSIDTF